MVTIRELWRDTAPRRKWLTLVRGALLAIGFSTGLLGAIAVGEIWEAAAVTFLFTFGAWLEARHPDQGRGRFRHGRQGDRPGARRDTGILPKGHPVLSDVVALWLAVVRARELGSTRFLTPMPRRPCASRPVDNVAGPGDWRRRACAAGES